MTQTGTPGSLQSPLIAAPAPMSRGGRTGFLSKDRPQWASNKHVKAAKRFGELLRQVREDLVGNRKKAAPGEDSPSALAAAPASQAVADSRGRVEEPGKGIREADAKQVPVSDGASAGATSQTVTSAEEERLTMRVPGTGPGGRPGEPPGSGGQTPGPETGSITQAIVTDGAEKPGSPSQGPGTGLSGIALSDLNIRGEAAEDTATPDSGATAADAGDVAPAGEGDASGQGASDTEGQAAADFGSGDTSVAEAPQGDTKALSPTSGITAAGPAHASDAKTVNLRDAADGAPVREAIVDRIEAFAKGGNPTVRLVLQPEHLGEVQVKLSLVAGAINATVKVDNPQVRDAVAQQLEAMRVSLADQGIKIDKLEVSVSGNSDQERPDAQDWLSNGQSQGQGDARARDGAGTWALPETYRSLREGGVDRADPGQEAEEQAMSNADRMTALDVVA